MRAGWVGVVALTCVLGAGARPSGQAPAAGAASGVHTLKVQGNVYMLVGAGGNIALQISDDGVLLVDTGTTANADKVVAAVRELTNKPIRYIINTSADPDHVGGNDTIGKLGSTIAGGNVGAGAGVGAGIIAHENVLTRMSAPTGKSAPYPTTAWPTDTFVSKQKELFFNGEAIQTIYKPGHSDADSIVYFRRSDVIVAGELFNTETYPVIDLAKGGSIKGVLAGLNDMLDIAIPKAMQEGGTYIIPGRGRLTDEADLLEYRDMVTIIRDRVQDGVKRGQTLDQVKAGKPTLDYDARWGATSGPWTTDMFLEAVYKDLKGAAAPAAAPAAKTPAPKK
ncbi:MAG TPA: MBL fold metallo-hydrolase [Vicinamibacterales bacterium]|nr:MBL fold metallo-hydrolase [Vicinamibacterales bacterium]